MADAGNITQLLQLASNGDDDARSSLYDAVYQELRRIARAHRRRWQGNQTLDTTALIHESFLKLAGDNAGFNDRVHFFATASRAMRQVLINYAERGRAGRRGGDQVRVTFSEQLPLNRDSVDELLQIDQLLRKLEARNERQSRLFECRVFGGMTIDETARALDVSPATVKRDWQLVSAWVYRELDPPRSDN